MQGHLVLHRSRLSSRPAASRRAWPSTPQIRQKRSPDECARLALLHLDFLPVVPAPGQRSGVDGTLAEFVREPSPQSHGSTAYRNRRRAEQINMVSRDDSLAGWCFAQFHVGKGIRRDIAPPDPRLKIRRAERMIALAHGSCVGSSVLGSIFCNSR